MRHLIVTGTTRGLGEAFAREGLAQGYTVHAISRRFSSEETSNERYHTYTGDLSIQEETQAIAERVFLACENAESIFLINNAGIVDPIVRAEDSGIEGIHAAFAVNCYAPFMFIQTFIKYFGASPKEKKILNISSGAATKPKQGWSTYCATKAALSMYTEVLAQEQQSQPYPIYCMSIAPGMVNTDMQQAIRTADEDAFPDKNYFVAVHENNELREPSDVAARLLAWMERESFGTEEIIARL